MPLDADRVAAAVYAAVAEASTTLRPDVLLWLKRAREAETSERGRAVLDQLVANADVARIEGVPLCQDTGVVWVHVALGSDERVGGDLGAAIDAAVADAYREGGLRASVCADALFDRDNTGDNTPAFVDVVIRPGTGATIDVMLKGGGSDNASVVRMLSPSDGAAGVERVVLDAVRARGASACPPLLVGVGVGGTFDSVAKLAKSALLRHIGTAGDPRAADLEAGLLAAINDTGIGPAGLGGDTTALAVHVATAPCHIASLPVAVNLGCCAVRTASVEL